MGSPRGSKRSTPRSGAGRTEPATRDLALVVDEFIGQEEAFIRPLGKPLEKISGLAGVTMLGDGRIVFVLDTLGLV